MSDLEEAYERIFYILDLEEGRDVGVAELADRAAKSLESLFAHIRTEAYDEGVDEGFASGYFEAGGLDGLQ